MCSYFQNYIEIDFEKYAVCIYMYTYRTLVDYKMGFDQKTKS